MKTFNLKIERDVFFKIKPILKVKYALKNINEVCNINKVTINSTIGTSLSKYDVLTLRKNIKLICNQKPYLIKSKKNISNFKLREGTPIAFKVTLRKLNMYNFIYKLIALVFPKLKDFRGLNLITDKFNNIHFGIHDHNVFPEINFSSNIQRVGLNVSFNLKNVSKDKSILLSFLRLIKFPFTNKL